MSKGRLEAAKEYYIILGTFKQVHGGNLLDDPSKYQ